MQRLTKNAFIACGVLMLISIPVAFMEMVPQSLTITLVIAIAVFGVGISMVTTEEDD